MASKTKAARRNGKPQAIDILLPVEHVAVGSLKPHPRNYRTHPQDQIEHIAASIRQHGLYRNVVVANDSTILAGHGVVLAAQYLKLATVPIRRLPIAPDHVRALKLLAADNGISHLVEDDDRALTEILKQIKDEDIDGLLGTGFDEKMLAALAFITRPASEMRTLDSAAEWAGMPEFGGVDDTLKIVVSFQNKKDRLKFLETLGVQVSEKARSMWYPSKLRNDLKALRFEQAKSK